MDGNGGGSDGSGAGADWYIMKCYQDGSSIKYQYSDRKDEFILPETTDILSVIGCGCYGPTCSASGTLKMSMTFEGYEFTFEIK